MKQDYFILLKICLSIMFLNSCSQSNEMIQNAKGVELTDAKTAYLTIQIQSPSRSVLPGVELGDLTDFVLRGVRPTNDLITIDDNGVITSLWPEDPVDWYVNFKKTLSNAQDGTSDPILIEPGVWDFTLTANKNTARYIGLVRNKDITSGENVLSFVLNLVDTGSVQTNGSVDVTLELPAGHGIKGAKAGLFSLSNDTEISGFGLGQIRPKNNRVTYSKNNVPSGTYRLKIYLYADDGCVAVVNTYREIVCVADGCDSTADRILSSLNEIYTIQYHNNGGEFTSSYAAPEMYSRSSDFMFANAVQITKDGYAFVGWYENEDFSGERLTEVVKNTTGNKDFYAKWATGTVVTPNNIAALDLSDKPAGYTIAVVGNVDLSVLSTKLKQAVNTVNVDLFATAAVSFADGLFDGCTKLTSIVLPNNLNSIGNNAFRGCTSLASIVITDTVTNIGSNPFGGCTSLAAIDVKTGNTKYKSVDGVLFSINGSTLIQYPAAKTDAAYEIPVGCQTVGLSAFTGNSYITEITVGKDITSLSPNAFNDCPNIIAYHVDVNNRKYDDNEGSGIMYEDEKIIRYPAGMNAAVYALPAWASEIGDYAFYGCTKLTTITVPASSELNAVGAYGMYGCTNLTTFELPDCVTIIGDHAFDGCPGDFGFYTFSFNANGGTEIESVLVRRGSSVPAPVNPIKQGFTFAGWYTTQDLTISYDFSTAVNNNTTVYAKWTLKDYDISYMLSGGTNAANNPSKYNIASSTITFGTPTRAHYTFDGWFTTAACTIGTETTGIEQGTTGNVTVYAKWTPITYTITYHISSYGTIPTVYPATYTVEDLSIDLPTPTGSTYTFAGWYASYISSRLAGQVTSLTAETVGNIELWAGWNKTAQSTYSWTRTNYGSYSFNNYSGNTWRSSNYNVNSSGATSTWTITLPLSADLSLPWSVSSESFDKLTITLDGSTIVSAKSGVTSGTYTARLAAGTHTLTAAYVKDGSVHSNEDRAYITLTPVTINGTGGIVYDDSSVPSNGLPTDNIVISGTEYNYTAMTVALSSEITITGSDTNWSSYCYSGADSYYKGAFISGRTVKISPFMISKYQVTQQLYEAVMNSGKTYDKGSGNNYPAYYVSWYDAITFCNKLSLLTGKTPCYSVSGITDWAALSYSSIPTSSNSTWNAATVNMNANGYRLPTEAEWEFAARGGDPTAAEWKYAFAGVNSVNYIYRSSTTSNTNYGGTNQYLYYDTNLATVGGYTNNSSSATHPVAGKTANRLGLYDMSGNVWEWCWDWYNSSVTYNDSAYTSGGVVTDPAGAASGSYRCIRGGSWGNYAYYCAVSYRSNGAPYSRGGNGLGFRLVCSVR